MKLLQIMLVLILIGFMSSVVHAKKCEDDPFTETDESLACDNAFKNKIGIEFVKIPSGSFMMGGDENDDEKPRHNVNLSSFYIGKYEVTQVQWYKVMKNNPAKFKTEKVGMNSRNHPIENVSWYDVQEFIKKLNKMDRKNIYRLPTEAEWEYACRSATKTNWFFGSESYIDNYAWHDGNSDDKTHKVGLKYPNKWGLYDMHGNVWEWCQDRYEKDYYSRSPKNNPQGPSTGSDRVLRGGGWYREAGGCRSAYRSHRPPDYQSSNRGFRLVRNPKN